MGELWKPSVYAIFTTVQVRGYLGRAEMRRLRKVPARSESLPLAAHSAAAEGGRYCDTD